MDTIIKMKPLVTLLQAGTRHIVPKGRIVQISSRNLIFYIQSGYVKRYMITNNGSESVQAIFGPTEVFPLTPIFRVLLQQEIYRGKEMYFYEAITEAKLYSIGESELLAAVENNPILYKDILEIAGVRLNSNIQRLENIALVGASSRVSHLLLYLANRFGKAEDQGMVIQVPLSHQDIAALLNMARETISHVIVRLKEKGIIDIRNKTVTVIDMDGLQKAAI